MKRQKLILAALIGALALAVIYAIVMTPAQERVSAKSGTVATGQSAVKSEPQTGQPGRHRVHLELLDRQPEKYSGYKRDIFNFARSKPKPQPQPEVVRKPPPPPPPSVPLVTPEIRQNRIRKQLGQFTFLGFLLKDAQRTVFLSRGEELFLVKKNDRFGDEQQFEAIDITPELLRIRQDGGSGVIDIPLVEKEPLIPSFAKSEGGRPYTPPAVETTPVPTRRQPPVPRSPGAPGQEEER